MSVFIYALCIDCEEQTCIGELAGQEQEWFIWNSRIDSDTHTGEFFKKHGRHAIKVMDEENPVWQEQLNDFKIYNPKD